MTSPALPRAFALLFASGAAIGQAPEQIYTLYRNSLTDPSMRIHVATFDAVDGKNFNRDSCDHTRNLYQDQPGVKTRFWCEPGRFRK